MRRPTPPGTPSRAARYLIPFDAGKLVRLSAAGSFLALIVGFGLYVAGLHRVASPGTLAAAHGAIDVQCAQCHQPAKQVIDLRCERCHDPLDTRRLEGAAHAGRIRAIAARVEHETGPACSTCHADHGGRRRDLTQVADRQCASCHTFTSMSSHPEFALVRAGSDAPAGIDFSHEIHLREIAKTGGDRCLSCHTPSSDQRTFEPIAFDTHCAKCHVLNGALTLNGTDLLKSGWTPAAVLPPATAGSPSRGEADERGRVTLERFAHRDPWTIAAAERLTRVIAGDVRGGSTPRDRDAARLNAVWRAVPLAALAGADLTTWLPQLDREIASLESALASGSTAGQSAAGGPDTLGSLDPAIAALLKEIQEMAVPAANARGGGGGIDAGALEERRREIAALLAAASARAPGAAARVAALQKRLADVTPSASANASLEAPAIRQQLDSLEDAVRTVEPGAAPTAAADIRGLAAEVRRQMGGGADPATTAAARARLTNLLNVMETRASTPLRARISDLRDTVAAVTAGDGLAALRERKLRLRERILIERTLRGEYGPATVDATINRDRSAAARELQALRSSVAAAPAAGLPPLDLEPARAKTALKGLLTACTACHRLDEDEAALRPVPATRSILTGAFFSHRPHTNQASCDTCHAVATSKQSVDVNLPPVKSCESCHDSARARADCVSCHTYHPPSAAAFLRASR